MELRCGRWQDVLTDVAECDAVITDPPYGLATHSGNDDLPDRQRIQYRHWGSSQVDEFVAVWSQRSSGWICAMTSDDLIGSYRAAYSVADGNRYSFAPVVIRSPRVRLVGDGPASEAVYLMVARPREKRFMGWGALPGWYDARIDRAPGIIGNKPIGLMRAIINDYSLFGDLVVDPCAGSGTTLLAAAIEGRRAIGAECDPNTYDLAVNRLASGYTPSMF